MVVDGWLGVGALDNTTGTTCTHVTNAYLCLRMGPSLVATVFLKDAHRCDCVQVQCPHPPKGRVAPVASNLHCIPNRHT